MMLAEPLLQSGLYPEPATGAAEVDYAVAFPAHTLEGHELQAIRAKEQLLMHAGWASSVANSVNLDGCITEVAVPLHPAARVRCQNCQKWVPASETAVTAIPEYMHPITGAAVTAATKLLSPRTRKEFKCQFHSGHYRTAGVTVCSGIHVGWSCCKANDRDAPGCALMLQHVEDKASSSCLQQFSSLEESCMSAELQDRLERLATEDSPEGLGEEADTNAECAGSGSPAGFVDGVEASAEHLHRVRTCDTLAGLSLRYGVSMQRIKEVNGIMGSSIVQYSTLIIPADEKGKCSKRKLKGAATGSGQHRLRDIGASDVAAVQQRRLISLRREMSILGGGSEEEARAYLAMAEDDAAAALEMFRQDVAWHQSGAAAQVAKQSCCYEYLDRLLLIH